MVISIIFGIGFGIIARKTRTIYLAAALYGVGLWIIGPLIIMPMMMGMGTNLAQAFALILLIIVGAAAVGKRCNDFSINVFNFICAFRVIKQIHFFKGNLF
jgi:hypothetical protein